MTHQNPAPQKKRSRTRIIALASAAALAVVFIIMIIVAAASGGDETAPPKKDDWVGQQDSPEPKRKDPAPQEPAAKGDVVIKSFHVGDPYPGDGFFDPPVGMADIVVTNHSSKVSDYLITVEVTDKHSGERLETMVAAAEGVAPDQRVDGTSAKEQGAEDGVGSREDLPKDAVARVQSVLREATVNE